MGFHMQAAKPDLNLPVMCITKHFEPSDQVKSVISGSQTGHQLSKMMTNETEIEKYSKFIEDRNQKIDLWHRQFENMTIAENGILKTFSEFEILKLQDNQKSSKENDARFNMIFADAAVQKLIDDYKGRFSQAIFNLSISSLLPIYMPGHFTVCRLCIVQF